MVWFELILVVNLKSCKCLSVCQISIGNSYKNFGIDTWLNDFTIIHRKKRFECGFRQRHTIIVIVELSAYKNISVINF